MIEGGTASISGGVAHAASSSNGLLAVPITVPIRISIGGWRSQRVTKFASDRMVAENHPHGSVGVHRGRLHLALRVAHLDLTLSANPVRLLQYFKSSTSYS